MIFKKGQKIKLKNDKDSRGRVNKEFHDSTFIVKGVWDDDLYVEVAGASPTKTGVVLAKAFKPLVYEVKV